MDHMMMGTDRMEVDPPTTGSLGQMASVAESSSATSAGFGGGGAGGGGGGMGYGSTSFEDEPPLLEGEWREGGEGGEGGKGGREGGICLINVILCTELGIDFNLIKEKVCTTFLLL